MYITMASYMILNVNKTQYAVQIYQSRKLHSMLVICAVEH